MEASIASFQSRFCLRLIFDGHISRRAPLHAVAVHTELGVVEVHTGDARAGGVNGGHGLTFIINLTSGGLTRARLAEHVQRNVLHDAQLNRGQILRADLLGVL